MRCARLVNSSNVQSNIAQAAVWRTLECFMCDVCITRTTTTATSSVWPTTNRLNVLDAQHHCLYGLWLCDLTTVNLANRIIIIIINCNNSWFEVYGCARGIRACARKWLTVNQRYCVEDLVVKSWLIKIVQSRYSWSYRGIYDVFDIGFCTCFFFGILGENDHVDVWI